eukprot:GHUV01038315.1.p1 GENE.GHUV01038315.1~~GHUV01038315.1.p1  ORF type:complete len:181 (-),score=45.18 GHUV01038315.1:121-663(-)
MPLVIAKTVLPDAQRFYLALGRIFGIGKAQGLAIAEEVGISKEARVADLKQHHVQQVRVTWHDLTSISGSSFTLSWEPHSPLKARQTSAVGSWLLCSILAAGVLQQHQSTPPGTPQLTATIAQLCDTLVGSCAVKLLMVSLTAAAASIDPVSSVITAAAAAHHMACVHCNMFDSTALSKP